MRNLKRDRVFMRSDAYHCGPLYRERAVALGPLAPAASASYPKLLLDEGQKPHEARAFDGGFDGALLLRREIRSLPAHHASVRIDELLEEVDILVVDVLDVILRQYVVAHSIFLISRT